MHDEHGGRHGSIAAIFVLDPQCMSPVEADAAGHHEIHVQDRAHALVDREDLIQLPRASVQVRHPYIIYISRPGRQVQLHQQFRG